MNNKLHLCKIEYCKVKKSISGAWKDYKVGILLKMNETILMNSY